MSEGEKKKPTTRIVVKEWIVGDIFRGVVLLYDREKGFSYRQGLGEGHWNSGNERIKNMVLGRATNIQLYTTLLKPTS